MKHLVLLLALSCVWSAAAEEFITVSNDAKHGYRVLKLD